MPYLPVRTMPSRFSGLGGAASDYTAALQAYQANPSQQTYDAAKEAYQAALYAWGQAAAGRAMQAAASRAQYAAAKKAWQKKKVAYDAAVAQRNQIAATAASLQQQHAQYQQALQDWTSLAQGAGATNASRAQQCASATSSYEQAHAAWVQAHAQWITQKTAYTTCLNQRAQQIAALNNPIFAQWGGGMPAGYPGCLSDPAHVSYYTRCTATFMEGLGAYPASAPRETSGPWTGVPLCMLAALPKCSQIMNCGSPPPSVPPAEPQPPVCQPPVTVPPKPTPPPPIPTVPPMPVSPGPAPTPPATSTTPAPPKPQPPEPFTPGTPPTLPPPSILEAGAGFGTSGLLLVALLAGGGYIGYRLMTRKPKAK